MESPFLSLDKSAEYLGIAKGTLINLRCRGKGPKRSRLQKYHIDDLNAWMRSQDVKRGRPRKGY